MDKIYSMNQQCCVSHWLPTKVVLRGLYPIVILTVRGSSHLFQLIACKEAQVTEYI